MQTYLMFLTYLLLIMLIGYWVNVLASRLAGGWVYRILVAPGVVVHELSHALGCLITGARIQSINVFKREGGEIQHSGSPIPVVGNVIISLMPVVVGVGILYFISRSFQFSISPPVRDLWVGDNFQSISNDLIFNFNYPLSIKSLSISFYLVFNLIATMAPSKQDLKVIWWDLLALAGIFYVLTLFGVTININTILPILGLSLIYSVLVLIFLSIFYFLTKFW